MLTLKIDSLHVIVHHINRYKMRDHEESKRELHFRSQMRKRKLNDSKTSAKTIKAALNTKPVRPLTGLTRDIEGPQGQPIGSIT